MSAYKCNVVSFNQHKIIRQLGSDPDDAALYYNLSLELSAENSIILSANDGEGDSKKIRYSKKDLLIKSIGISPTNACAFLNLANLIGAHENVALMLDGNQVVLTNIELYVKAIEIDPTYTTAYCNLAACMQNQDVSSIALPIDSNEGVKDCPLYTPLLLYKKALSIDDKLTWAYNNAGLLLQEDQIFENVDGKKMSAAQLFIKAIEVDPGNDEAYYNLSTTLSSEQERISITINHSVQSCNRIELLRLSIFHNPKNAKAFYNLAISVFHSSDKFIELNFPGSKGRYSEKDLYIKAIESDSSMAFAYYNLALLLKSFENVKVFVKSRLMFFNKKDLLLATIHLRPDYAPAYHKLAEELADETSTVEITYNGRRFELTRPMIIDLANNIKS